MLEISSAEYGAPATVCPCSSGGAALKWADPEKTPALTLVCAESCAKAPIARTRIEPSSTCRYCMLASFYRYCRLYIQKRDCRSLRRSVRRRESVGEGT